MRKTADSPEMSRFIGASRSIAELGARTSANDTDRDSGGCRRARTGHAVCPGRAPAPQSCVSRACRLVLSLGQLGIHGPFRLVQVIRAATSAALFVQAINIVEERRSHRPSALPFRLTPRHCGAIRPAILVESERTAPSTSTAGVVRFSLQPVGPTPTSAPRGRRLELAAASTGGCDDTIGEVPRRLSNR